MHHTWLISCVVAILSWNSRVRPVGGSSFLLMYFVAVRSYTDETKEKTHIYLLKIYSETFYLFNIFLLTFASGTRLDLGKKKKKKMTQLQSLPSRHMLFVGKDTSNKQQPACEEPILWLWHVHGCVKPFTLLSQLSHKTTVWKHDWNLKPLILVLTKFVCWAAKNSKNTTK